MRSSFKLVNFMSSQQKSISLFIVLLIAFIDWMGLGLVYPMFSSMLFHPDLGFISADTSDALKGFWLGLLLAVMAISQFFSSPILGTISDQKGRKPILKIALLIGIFGYMICVLGVWQRSLILLLFGRIIVGISAGSAAVVGAVIADLSRPEEKAKNFALWNMACGIGFTVGPFLGGKLSEIPVLSWSGPFLFSAFVLFLNFLLLVYLFKESYHIRKEGKIGISQGIKNLKKAWHLPELRILFLSIFLFCFAWSFFWEFIPVTWIEEYHLNASQVGNFYAYGAGFYALSCGLLIRPIVKRFAPQKILFYALLLSGCYMFFLLLSKDPAWLWTYIPPLQFLIALLFPTAAAMISNWVKDDAQGEIMGILQSVEAAAFAISPLSGILVGLNYDMPIILGGSAMILSGIVLGVGCKKVFKNSP